MPGMRTLLQLLNVLTLIVRGDFAKELYVVLRVELGKFYWRCWARALQVSQQEAKSQARPGSRTPREVLAGATESPRKLAGKDARYGVPCRPYGASWGGSAHSRRAPRQLRPADRPFNQHKPRPRAGPPPVAAVGCKGATAGPCPILVPS
eukprot:scaffold2058_cov403-Prasinococcus_capsulatus_cf.AAC.15